MIGVIKPIWYRYREPTLFVSMDMYNQLLPYFPQKQTTDMDINSLIGYAKAGDESARRILADTGIDWDYAITHVREKPLPLEKIKQIHETLVQVSATHGITMQEARDGLEKAIRESPTAPILNFNDPVKYLKTGVGRQPVKRGTNRTPPKKKRK